MDLYVEQTLLNEDIDKHEKRTGTLNIIRFICLSIAGLVIVLLPLFPLKPESVLSSIFFNLVLAIIISVPFIAAFFIISRYLNKTNLEFDYLLSDNVFKIIKIIKRKKRKNMLKIPISSFESLGCINCDAYDRLAASKQNKNIYAIKPSLKDDEIFYIYFVQDGEKTMLHFAPDRELIRALKRSVARLTIIDKSFKVNETKQYDIS